MHDSELLRCYTLDHAGIMFVTDLIRDMLTSLTLRWNTIVPEMNVINKINMFGNWKKCNNAAVMIWVCYSTCYVSVHFLYNTLSMKAW